MLSIRPQIAKVAKARVFTYIPRYYDERKEKIAEMERQIRKEEADQSKGEKRVHEFHFRSAMSNRWRGEEYSSAVRKSNITILILIVGIVAAVYYLFKRFDMIEQLMPNLN